MQIGGQRVVTAGQVDGDGEAAELEPEERARWEPTEIKRVIRVLGTSTAPIVVATDQGNAFVKERGNPEGPDALACEFLGTALAGWLGLGILDVVVLDFPPELCVPLANGRTPVAGPAFATRSVVGAVWGGTPEETGSITNPEHFAGLVVLDCWLRNHDRYCVRRGTIRCNRGNVFLTEEDAPRGKYRLLAIDHTHAIRQAEALGVRTMRIENERDDHVYGLFPEVISHVTSATLAPFVEKLREASTPELERYVQQTPTAWLPHGEVRRDLAAFLSRRAQHVANGIENWLEGPCGWPQAS